MQPNTLLEQYGFKDARPGQEWTINKVVNGESSLTFLKTGEGKSLCYQLPATLLDGITIVISPLLALMADQLLSAKKLGISAVAINSDLHQNERMESWGLVQQGLVKLLYVSPEHATTVGFAEQLQGVKVSRIVVDEAHCISQWGHDFRPSYMRIGNLAKALNNPSIHAFTATATPVVRQEICESLGIPDDDVFVGRIKREELDCRVERVESPYQRLLELLEERFSEGKILIYCSRIKDVENLTRLLNEEKRYAGQVVQYYGGLELAWKTSSQATFTSGKTSIMIATNAFGMGVDIPDIRTIIHYQLPSSVEELWQEMGRGGRDGNPTLCVALFDEGYFFRQWQVVHRSTLNIRLIRTVLNYITGGDVNDDTTEKSFIENRAAEHFSGAVPSISNQFISCVALLQDAGLIEVFQGKLKFKFSIKDYREKGLPLSLKQIQNLGQTGARQIYELSEFIKFVTEKEHDFQTLISEHFRGEMIKDEIPDNYLPSLVRDFAFEKEVLLAIVKGSAASPRTSRGLAKWLTNEKRDPDEFGACAQIGEDDMTLMIEIAIAQGYLSVSSVPAGRMLAPSDSPEKRLGLEWKMPKTAAALKKIRYWLEAKKLYSNALREYWENRPMLKSKQEEYLLAALETNFTLLEKEILGLNLLQDVAGKTLAAYVKSAEDDDAKRARSLGFVRKTFESLFKT